MKLEVDLPDGILASLRRSPSEFSRDLLMAAACKWYEAGVLSQERAAELAGCSRAVFLTGMAQYQVSPYQETSAELQKAAQW